MQFKHLALTAALGASALAQRPTNVSMCDYYTGALLTNNTAANQYTLLKLLVNTVVIGNFSKVNVGIKVPGILAPGTYNGVAVNLLPYFDGGLASTSNFTNQGQAIAVNFLDDGGAAPLLNVMPSNTNTSAQYILLTHLYTYFGVLLGCSGSGTTDFPAYTGRGSQYNVHRFMDLSQAEVGYFITQVGLAAASFGVTTADVTTVGTTLNKVFGYKCSPPTTVVPSQGAQLQSICTGDNCPLDPAATCAAYQTAIEPLVANATLAMGEGRNASSSMSSMMSGSSTMMSGATSTAKASGSGSATTTGVAAYTGAADALKAQAGAILGGAAALIAMAL